MPKIQCSTCGGIAEVGASLEGECPYCGCTVTIKRISSFNAVAQTDIPKLRIALEQNSALRENSDLALALCYLKVGNFTLAKKKLTKVIDDTPECAEGYYYYAVAMLNDRDLSELTIREAKQTAEYLQTAIALDETFLFPKLFYALLCIEYYEANELQAPANGNAMLQDLCNEKFDAKEFEFFKSTIKTNVI